MHPRRATSGPRQRLVALAMAMLFSLLSCGRELTGPGEGIGVRYAEGLSFLSQFPEPLQGIVDGVGSVVAFERVRVVFRRSDGTVALDTMIAFGAGIDSVRLSLRVVLDASAPPSGELLALTLAFVNAAGDTVFRGGPVTVTARLLAQGAPPPDPVPVPLRYTGVGAAATTVVVSPETLSVVAGDPFAFTAVARDALSALIAGTPLVFTSLDPTRATITAPGAGSGGTTALRGVARIRVQLPTGAAADTATLIVIPRPGALSVASGGGQTAAPSAALPQIVGVRLAATDGQPLASAPISVVVTSGGGSVGGGSVTPLATVTDNLGLFAFNWTLGALAGTQSVTVSSPGVPNLVITASAVITTATQLRIVQQLGTTYQAGDSLPLLLVEARNPQNARDTTFADSVFLSFAVNATEATLVGTARVRAVAGLARFENFRLQRAGTGYRLLVTAPGLGSDTSTAFAITSRAGNAIVLQSGGSQTAAPGAVLAQPIVVRVVDIFTNPVAGRIVAFSVATGLVSAAADTTDIAGLASIVWTLGAPVGTQSLLVTAAGLIGSPLTVTANDGPGIVTTDVTPAFDTLTALGATRTFSAVAYNGQGGIMAGSYTWVSRAPAVATVGPTGTVTAIAVGETWIVATEVGGTRDSARVVVDQRLATILVTPGARSIYLGASFTFTASAVDGRGVALAAQPAFTWTTVSSAIASITAGGIATGVGLGATQVRATAGAVTGTSALTVLSPILRIAVVRDSLGFTATDTFSLAALARTRSYRAVAYDTLDAAMTGITVAWASSNPSVATIDSSGPVTARLVALANGFTAVRATAQGVTGAASLTVAQVMTSVELSPAAASIAPTGTVVLTARRRDASNFFIPGGSFTFASDAVGVATVSASGVVTGVAIGSAGITATSAAITSAPATVTVTNSVPPIISFGRDTLAIGRSATNVSIPIYLTRPYASAVTVNLAVADTFAFFSPVSITIPAGQTVGTASLNGRNSGTTQVFATDGGGGGGYAGDTAVLAVQASVRLVPASYSMIVNDERPGQVLLTDPAPAGGSFITFAFGTPGRVSVSPDPAFIPAGQLSANIVIRGLTAGTTTLTPASTGVNGVTSNVTTSPAVLVSSGASLRMGAGQFIQSQYLYVQQALTNALTISLVSSDTTVVTVPAQIIIPSASNVAYFNVTGRATGSATITSTAPGWTGTTTSVVVTTPNVGLSGGGTYNTTQPAVGVTVYSRDSTLSAHYRTNSLVVQLSSSDTTVLRVVTPTVTIAAGLYYGSGQVIAGGSTGTAKLYATASGHGPDSVNYTFVGPKLEFSFTSNLLGAGQFDQNQYLYTPNAVTAPLTVTLANADSSIAAVPTQVTIPASSNVAYFNVRGKAPGLTRFIATAPGYSPDTASYRVSSPRLSLSGGGTLNNFSGPSGLLVYSIDSLGGAHYRSDTLIVSYVSTNPAAMTVTAADTIRPGLYYANAARVTPVGVGTATIIVSAPGHGADSVVYTVITPKLNFSIGTYRIGRRQFTTATDLYVYIPTNRTVPVPVTITQSNAAIDSLTSTALTIPANNYYQYFGLAGLGTGVDTLIATAAGYLPDTALVIVTSPRLLVSGITGSATTTSPPTTAYLYIADSVGTTHYTMDTLLVSARSSNDAVIQPDSVGFRIPRGAYYRSTGIRFVGPGTASMTYTDSLGTGYTPPATTNNVTVTGPSLGLYNYNPTLGMRQNGGLYASYVAIPNAIATPLVVNLLSTDSTVASVPATITIPAGQTYAYFPVSAKDVVGTVQIQATATGYSTASFNQQVTLPRFTLYIATTLNTTALPSAITVYPADAAGTSHYTNEAVTVTLTSSNPAAGTFDSATVVIPAGGYYNNAARFIPAAAGTTTVTATDARGTAYSYSAGSASVAVVTPSLVLSWSGAFPLGIGQWAEPYVYVPDTRITPLAVSLAHSGSASTSAASVTIPTASNIVYPRITGVAAGLDSITFGAPGHNSIVGAVAVGLGRVDALSSWPTTLNDSVAVILYARDPSGGVRNVAAATTFGLAVSSGAFAVRSLAGATITSVTIPVDAQSVTFRIVRLTSGSATLTITNANYQTQITPVVTVP